MGVTKEHSKKSRCVPSTPINMVFVLPPEYHAARSEEVAIAQMDLGLRPIMFEKPPEKDYMHLKALYLRIYIDGRPVNRMMVDSGAAVNIMPYSILRRLGKSKEDLIRTNMMLSDFNGQLTEAMGVLNVDLTVGSKTIPTSFFVTNGQDWIHANCCIPSTMHQCLI